MPQEGRRLVSRGARTTAWEVREGICPACHSPPPRHSHTLLSLLLSVMTYRTNPCLLPHIPSSRYRILPLSSSTHEQPSSQRPQPGRQRKQFHGRGLHRAHLPCAAPETGMAGGLGLTSLSGPGAGPCACWCRCWRAGAHRCVHACMRVCMLMSCGETWNANPPSSSWYPRTTTAREQEGQALFAFAVVAVYMVIKIFMGSTSGLVVSVGLFLTGGWLTKHPSKSNSETTAHVIDIDGEPAPSKQRGNHSTGTSTSRGRGRGTGGTDPATGRREKSLLQVRDALCCDLRVGVRVRVGLP